ncbi:MULTISPECIES: LysR family transcriptional regulator [Acidithiobacillus]|jgi:LysR family glycine cleavage system transcriptional activator|uniref:Transcriptional regulator, LysR family n=3 Tax=Acidithiobacillus ferrooxidans TaxID=920 RepID=B7J6T9_ACIF2|nr:MULTISPECIES: LysR family transcriptional regulator [Acidithiobacillus]MCL5956009.1 LysR family transcriptional regulator [Gammaproteobacteria bacterium]ACH83248.1 transcriptional regulator, LysR family [Acidithiobacillus ferrooxidans ATCC 53993]ACK78868.1 transcriptional regulator, LysR family [Acidithiobacillus ferrooxidans ATCC 23270]MBN6745677.1 LysR family transcriptional regulator [Acidithiobacillus sp. MC2.2]MBN6748633.1 LysR family transcriptional regulator [Acidithiobacillus sp. PG
MKSPVHLNALRAFEASARHQSFSAAAAELNVTAAAVGQLVRSLEDWLGTPLFVRGSSGRVRLIPTEAAERALPDIRAGFDRLTLGILLREHWRLQKPADLAQETLIHDLSMDRHTAFPTWEAWMKKAGVTDVITQRGMRINNSAAVLQAAIEGHGVALARSVMARDDLASGRLVRLFPDIDFASALAYYVVYRPECASLPKLTTFRDWLLAEAAPAQAGNGEF